MSKQDVKLQIAIDGPASSGKSTVAKKLAQDLSLIYIDTGAMYRALTWLALKNGIAPSDEKNLIKLLSSHNIHFNQQNSEQSVWIDDIDVTSEIRTKPVNDNVSEVSAHPQVREALVEKQRQLSGEYGVVMDGRDIGTVVLPQADVKIFLVASAEERARRRHQENLEHQRPSDYEEVLAQLKRRDAYDSSRKHSPLKQADDAIAVDTTDLSIDEVVQKIKSIIAKKSK